MSQIAKLITKPLSLSPSREITDGDVLKRYRVSEVSANTTTKGTEDVIAVDASGGAVTVTLKTPVIEGQEVFIKKTDGTANAVTVATEGSETIDGASTQSLASQYDKIRVVSDSNDNWLILNT